MTIIIILIIGLIFGVFSAFADGWYSSYWQGGHNFLMELLLIAVGLVGNAAGIWAIGATIAGYIASRGRRWPAGIIAATGFLALAIAGYYLTISIAALRPGAGLSATASRWLVVALAIGLASGVAGAWLAQAKHWWRQAAAVALLMAYVALDGLLLLQSSSSGFNGALLAVWLMYAAAVLAFCYHAVQQRRWRILATATVAFIAGAIVIITLWPVINQTLLRLQHGEPVQYQDPNTIYVN